MTKLKQLIKEKLMMLAYLPDKALHDASVEVLNEWGDHVVRLIIREYTEKMSEEPHIVSYPRDWWQAFKERFFPLWLRKQFPVIYTDVAIDCRVVYPNFRPAMSEEKHYYISSFATQESDRT